MAENPALRVRVSLPHGHFTVPAVTAERGGWTVLPVKANDKSGKPRRSKPRKPRAPRLRVDNVAATPATTETEAPASADTPKESA